MKRYLYISSLLILMSSCYTRLDDVKLNDNPYDSEYDGPKVVVIDSIVFKYIASVGYNYVYISGKIDMYDEFSFYKNGVLINTYTRGTLSTPGRELVIDAPVVFGQTNTFQAQLKYLGKGTSLSDPVVFTTP